MVALPGLGLCRGIGLGTLMALHMASHPARGQDQLSDLMASRQHSKKAKVETSLPLKAWLPKSMTSLMLCSLGQGQSQGQFTFRGREMDSASVEGAAKCGGQISHEEQKKSQIDSFTLYLKESQNEQTKPQNSRRKEIMKTGTEIKIQKRNQTNKQLNRSVKPGTGSLGKSTKLIKP